MLFSEDISCMLRNKIVAWILALIVSSTAAQAQYVHTRGPEVVDGKNKPLLLRGINLGDWLVPEGYMWHLQGSVESPREMESLVTELIGPTQARDFWHAYRQNYITQADVHLIKQAGFNSIRVPLHYKFFLADDAEGFALVDRLLAWCKQEGLYVVLDMHAAPGAQTGKNIDDSDGYPWLMKDAASQEQAVAVWQRIARHYKDDRTVIGYDLLNEPIPNYPKLKSLEPLLEPLYKKLTAAIRQIDTHHMMIYGGAQWDGDFSVFGPPFDSNALYTWHRYHSEPTEAAFKQFVDFRAKNNVPIWLGESGENNDDWIAKFRDVLEKNDIGWAFWPYKKMDATTSVVSFSRPEGWDAVIAFAAQQRATVLAPDRLKMRPEQEQLDRVFASFLESIRLSACRVNEGYVHALLPQAPAELTTR